MKMKLLSMAIALLFYAGIVSSQELVVWSSSKTVDVPCTIAPYGTMPNQDQVSLVTDADNPVKDGYNPEEKCILNVAGTSPRWWANVVRVKFTTPIVLSQANRYLHFFQMRNASYPASTVGVVYANNENTNSVKYGFSGAINKWGEIVLDLASLKPLGSTITEVDIAPNNQAGGPGLKYYFGEIVLSDDSNPRRDPSNREFGLYTYIDFRDGIKDKEGHVTNITSKAAGSVEIAPGRIMGELKENGYVTLNQDPIGDYKYTFAFSYRKDKFTEADKDKVLFKFSCANGDYIALYNRYTPATGAKLEVVSCKSGEIRNTGLSRSALKEGEVNSIFFTQTYTESISGCKLYVNSSTSAKVVVNFASNEFKFNKWSIGSEVPGETATGNYGGLSFYGKELLSYEMKNFMSFQSGSIALTVDPTKKFQTIRNFGGSDGWHGQATGIGFNEASKARMAELLFSTEVDADGNPKGVGFTGWRFNIGSGTAEQGDASGIHVERRTECFMNMDGTFDWTKQAGQRYFLEKAAKTYHVPDIIGWQNSPPVRYTYNNKGFLQQGQPNETILLPQYFEAYGEFLSTVVNHFKEEGINFKYISPLNEPELSWSGGTQEGCPWTIKNISDVCKAIDKTFQRNNVSAKLFVTEASGINYWLSDWQDKETSYFKNLYNPESSLSLHNTPSVSNIASAHSYWTETDAQNLVNWRRSMANAIKDSYPNMEYWQTEYCFNSAFSWGHETAMTPAMSAVSLSRVIHADLVHGNCTGWQWWTTFEHNKNVNTSLERFGLIRIAISSDKDKSLYYPTKLLYGLGNYSRFVRPGMKRIQLNRSDNMDEYTEVTNQFFSSYMDEETGKIVIVATNFVLTETGIVLPRVDLGELGVIEKYTPYVTTNSEKDNITRYPDVNSDYYYLMPKTSIITFVGIPEKSGSAAQRKINEVKIINSSSTKTLQIQSEKQIKEVSILDMFGRVIKNEKINNIYGEMSTSCCLPGAYLVNITLENNVETHKIVIE